MDDLHLMSISFVLYVLNQKYKVFLVLLRAIADTYGTNDTNVSHIMNIQVEDPRAQVSRYHV